MAGDTDDTEANAARLEAALERIAQHAGAHPPHVAAATDATAGVAEHSGEIAARLDTLIDRLRAALAGRPQETR